MRDSKLFRSVYLNSEIGMQMSGGRTDLGGDGVGEAEAGLHDENDDRNERNAQHLSHLDPLALLGNRVGVAQASLDLHRPA